MRRSVVAPSDRQQSTRDGDVVRRDSVGFGEGARARIAVDFGDNDRRVAPSTIRAAAPFHPNARTGHVSAIVDLDQDVSAAWKFATIERTRGDGAWTGDGSHRVFVVELLLRHVGLRGQKRCLSRGAPPPHRTRKRRGAPTEAGAPHGDDSEDLGLRHIGRLRTFLALDDLELDSISLGE